MLNGAANFGVFLAPQSSAVLWFTIPGSFTYQIPPLDWCCVLGGDMFQGTEPTILRDRSLHFSTCFSHGFSLPQESHLGLPPWQNAFHPSIKTKGMPEMHGMPMPMPEMPEAGKTKKPGKLQPNVFYSGKNDS